MPANGDFSFIRALVFDLDGTLIESRRDLALAANAMLAQMGRPHLSDEVVAGYVGHGAPTLVKRALAAGGPDAEPPAQAEIDKGLEFFLAYYRQHMLDHTFLYPGVPEALHELDRAGLRMAVLTNKPENFSRAILHGLGVSKHFRRVYGGNSFSAKKPDPLGLRTLLREMEAAPREAMMVGDSDVDVQTARNAGVWACGVTYGFNPESLKDPAPDLWLDGLGELPAILSARPAASR